MSNVFVATGFMSGKNEIHKFDLVSNHPRVHLQSGDSLFGSFMIEDRTDDLPSVFDKHREEFKGVIGG